MDVVLTFISTFLTIYLICIFGWALLSWFRIGYDHPLHPVQNFLNSIIMPYLKLFQGFIPPVSLGGAQLDLSAMVGMLLIYPILLQYVLPALQDAF
jgi:uncharacterized protein YggT (Ycf19 family)